MISIVVPCYNEALALPLFYKEIKKLALKMHYEHFEFLFINDGSKDATLSIIQELAASDDRVRYVSFSRNFGKEAAVYAGLQNARGEYVAIMDADLQDPPSLLEDMYKIVAVDGYDSVATRRVTRKGEPPIRSFCARIFYKLMNKISQVEMVDGARDYRLMNRKFVDAVLSLNEYNRFTKGIFGWIGFKNKWIEFENVERIAGETKWSFWKLVLYAMDGIIAFSTMPLVIATIMGILCCILAMSGVIFIIIRKLLFGDPVQGWASMTCIMLSLGGIQLFCMGLLGQYLSKTYLETKRRPIYIVDKTNINN